MSIVRNLAAAFASLLGATVWTKGLSYLVNTKRIRPYAARKVMHITTAPLFVLTWPLYAPQRHAAYFAAVIPFSFALRILSNPTSDSLVRAVAHETTSSFAPSSMKDADQESTRTGGSSVHLRHAYGPISYGLSVSAVTFISWRNSPETYIALAALCFGDGMADVIGSACKGPRWPLPPKLFVKKKTIPGTLAFFLSTLLGSAGFLNLARLGGAVHSLSWKNLVVVAGSSAAVELLPVEDNITVPLSAFLIARAM